MEIVIVDSADEVAQVVADLVASVLAELSFTNSRLFLLDEYVGLPPDHPMCNRSSIGRDFADQVDVNADALQCLDVTMPDAGATCAAYEKSISVASVEN